MLVRIFVGCVGYPTGIQQISALGVGSESDIQHPQIADLDVKATSKSIDLPQSILDTANYLIWKSCDLDQEVTLRSIRSSIP
jgi:hypothetical protein